MNYVMSDVYGNVEKFERMIKTIDLKEEDNLYLLGNFIGGEGSVEMLRLLADSVNIFPVIGAAEKAALDVFRLIAEQLRKKKPGEPSDKMKKAVDEAVAIGSKEMISEFVSLDGDEKTDMIDFMSDLPIFEICDSGDKTFILVPRGLGNFDKNGKKLKRYTFEDLSMTEVDYNKNYMNDDNVFIVSGTVPVDDLGGDGKVYRSNNNICINGDLKNGGRLLCLCLDTMEEFSVE